MHLGPKVCQFKIFLFFSFWCLILFIFADLFYIYIYFPKTDQLSEMVVLFIRYLDHNCLWMTYLTWRERGITQYFKKKEIYAYMNSFRSYLPRNHRLSIAPMKYIFHTNLKRTKKILLLFQQ